MVDEAARPVVVVLDSNAWISQTLLRSKLAAVLLYWMRARQVKLILPEVVRNEVVERVADKGRADIEAGVNKLQEGLRYRGEVLSQDFKAALPNQDSLRATATARFDELSERIEEVALKLEHVRNVLQSVYTGGPFKESDFRDGLIWEVVLECLEYADVCLVTQDAVFFDPNKRDLRASLDEQVGSSAGTLALFRDLSALTLDLASAEPTLPEPEIMDQVRPQYLADLAKATADQGFDLGEETGFSITGFATTDFNSVLLEISVTGRCVDRQATADTPDRLGEYSISAEATFDLATGAVADFKMDRIALTHIDPDTGERVSYGGIAYLRGLSAYLGAAPSRAPMTVRSPLDPGPGLT